MIYYVPHTVIYVTERRGRVRYRFSDWRKSGADAVFRSDWTRSLSARPLDDFRRAIFAVGPSEHKHFIYVDKAFARLLHHYTIATTTTTTTYYTYIQFAVSRAKRPELVYRFRDPKGTFKKTVSRRSIIPHRVRMDADRPSDVNYVNKNENNKGLKRIPIV